MLFLPFEPYFCFRKYFMKFMKRKTQLSIFLIVLLMGRINAWASEQDDTKILYSVADWQITHFSSVKHHSLDWTNGAFYKGLLAWADCTNEQRYYQFLLDIGNKNQWSLLKRTYHADDICVGQMYIGMYKKYKQPEMLRALRERADTIVEHPSQAKLYYGAPNWSQRWSWCDALFMAPPVFAELYNIQNDEKYLRFMDKEFRECTDSLYDQDDNLFFRDRRYIMQRGEKGEKVFWGRGNGWVFAGLTFLLETLPRQHDTYNYYLKIYRDLAASVVKYQGKTGSWSASLLNEDAFPGPENSCSGFFVYGLAWGVNRGILTDKLYKDAAVKGWNTLKSFVDTDGKLGYVQPVSAAPGKVKDTSTEVYGVGAFLLAGVEMLKMKK